jgi:hypothetical protein
MSPTLFYVLEKHKFCIFVKQEYLAIGEFPPAVALDYMQAVKDAEFDTLHLLVRCTKDNIATIANTLGRISMEDIPVLMNSVHFIYTPPALRKI